MASAGSTGASGVSGYQLVTGAAQTLTANTTAYFYVNCPTGKVAISGGYQLNTSDLKVEAAVPNGNRFELQVSNPDPQAQTVHPFAVCALAT